jgi:hypothetical protein
MAQPPPYPDGDVAPGNESPAGTPRWVKVAGLVVVGLVVLVLVVLLTGIGGEHGPGRHLPTGGAAGDSPAARAAGYGAPRP